MINNRTLLDAEEWSQDTEILQVLDCLSSYPNEFWKYPVVTYYLSYHSSPEFVGHFKLFLRKLFATLSSKYIVYPTVNIVKTSILNLNAEIINSLYPTFDFSEVDENELKDKIKKAHRNTVRMILKAVAYNHQYDLLPEKWEIEHIFPRQWQTNYFPTTNVKEVKELVDHIGNKLPFEKKLNIIAGNGYFTKKQFSYGESKIQIVLDLAQKNSNWGLDEIRERDIRMADELVEILRDWGLNAEQVVEEPQFQVTIPDDKIETYHNFLKMFGKEDSDENRERFLEL